jgi:hypothetical protein
VDHRAGLDNMEKIKVFMFLSNKERGMQRYAYFLLGFLFYSEDRSDTFLRNISELLPNYTALELRTLYSSYTSL